MRRTMKGSMTVEAAYIIPLILMVFGASITLLFYYHDKTLLLSATQEAAVYAGSGEEKSEKKIREHLEILVKGRMLLFDDFQVSVVTKERTTDISCTAKNNLLSLQVQSHMERTNPEDYIRMFRKLEKIGEEVTKSEKLYEE